MRRLPLLQIFAAPMRDMKPQDSTPPKSAPGSNTACLPNNMGGFYDYKCRRWCVHQARRNFNVSSSCGAEAEAVVLATPLGEEDSDPFVRFYHSCCGACRTWSGRFAASLLL